jgi:hypothetical protein
MLTNLLLLACLPIKHKHQKDVPFEKIFGVRFL